MSQKSEIRNLMKQRFEEKQNRIGALPGQLGDGYGHITVTGREHYVYCRLAGTIVEVFNNRVPAENDLLVMVGYDPTQPDLFQILSTRSALPGGLNGGAVTGYASSKRYQWMAQDGGQDPIFIDKRQYLPLRIGAMTGMLLQVYRDFVWTGTGWFAVNTQNFSMASYIPATTGKAALVLITIDDTGTVIKTKGSEVNIADLSITDIPAVPTGTVEVLGAVRVYYGQTAIYEARTNTDIIDLRNTWTAAGEGGTLADHDHSGDAGDGGTFDAANLTSGTATDGYVLTADGAGGAAWEATPGGTGNIKLDYSNIDVSTPPTQENINAAFGAPYTAGQGFIGLLNDSGLSLREYLCISDGADWHIAPFSKAASSLGYASLTRYGTVLAATGLTGEDSSVYEPTVIIEGGLWKMWYTYGWSSPLIGYATSPDGKTWTKYASNPVISGVARSTVLKDSTTYYLYGAPTGDTAINLYTSSDGIAWTLDTANVIAKGTAGAWDASGIANSYVWKEDAADWRMLYEARGAAGIWKIGYATSSDGRTWTKSGSNPVISETGSNGGPWVYKYGSTYYLWSHRSASGGLPTDIVRWHSTDLTTWSYDGIMLARSGTDEGGGSSVGQVADPFIVIHNHVMYLYHAASSDGTQSSGAQHIKLVTGAEGLLWQ